MSHTPGPWIIDGDVPEKLGFQGWLCTATGPLGRMEPVCHIEAVSAADVRLIAAAPDLLAALKLAEDRLALLIECDNEDRLTGACKYDVEAFNAARAALAKAGL